MPLHFFSTTRLARKLSRDEVDSEQQAYYLLANSVILSIFFYSGLIPSSFPLWSLPLLLEALATIGIWIIGIAKTYEAAGGRNSRQFLVRFTCLSLPVSVTTLLLVWFTYWAVRIGLYEGLIALSNSHFQVALNLSRLGTDFLGLLGFCATVSASIITFWRLARLLAQVRELAGENNAGA
jgi:hypothetical protein